MWSARRFLMRASFGARHSSNGTTAPLVAAAAGATALYVSLTCSSSRSTNKIWVHCEQQSTIDEKQNAEKNAAHLRKRRATLKAAAATMQSPPPPPQRRLTRDELAQLRIHEREIMQRWERDEEDGWRELPARAWPAYQPDETAMRGIQKVATTQNCLASSSSNKNSNKECQELLFQIATTLVFYNVDPQAGLKQYKELAESGHVDSMVACGVVLVEGLGIPAPREQEGIEWLQKAASLGSSQACYELGTVCYTGIDGVVPEDSVKAFSYFERAAKNNHVAAMYMLADCLAEGEGTDKDVARAVPLFYEAGEQGHRFARQRIRELLRSKRYTTA